MTWAPEIGLARVYDAARTAAGARLLVDRIWPRGVRKDDLKLDDWIKAVAPGSELRTWFGHDPGKWDEFRRRCRAELDDNGDAVAQCRAWCRKGPVVLLFAAKDRDHNHAVVLRDYLRARPANEAPT